MSKGRRPKTTELRIIDGDRRDRINEAEPRARRARRAPSAPAWLSDAAKKIFRAEARILHELGTLTTADVAHLARYAALEAVFRSSVEALQIAPMLSTQSGTLRANPIGSQTVAIASALRGYANDLGLSSASRSAIRMTAPDEDDGVADLRRLLG